MLGGFLFKSADLDWPTALFMLGAAVTACSFASFAVTFSPEPEVEVRLADRSRGSAIAGGHGMELSGARVVASRQT